MMVQVRLAVIPALALIASCSSDVDVPTGGGGPGGAGPGSTGSQITGAQSANQSTGAQPSTSTSGTSGPTSTSGTMSTGSSSGSVMTTSTGGMVTCDSATPCQDCVATSCADVWCDCTEDMECGALFTCWSSCMDETCTQACLQQYPNAISKAILVTNCASGPCAMACPQSGEPLEPCGECLYTSCDAEMNACLSNPDCSGLWACFIDCGQFDLTCQQDCYAAFPTGAEPLEDVFGCADMECQMVCN